MKRETAEQTATIIFAIMFAILMVFFHYSAGATENTDDVWRLWNAIDTHTKGSTESLEALNSLMDTYGMKGKDARLDAAEKVQLVNEMTAHPATTAEGIRAQIWILQNIHESMLALYLDDGSPEEVLNGIVIPGCVLMRTYPLFRDGMTRFPNSPVNMVVSRFFGSYAGDISEFATRYMLKHGQKKYDDCVALCNQFASDKDAVWSSLIYSATEDLTNYVNVAAAYLESSYSTTPPDTVARVANRLALAHIKEYYQGQEMQAALVTADITASNWSSMVFPSMEVVDIYDVMGDRSLWSKRLFGALKMTTPLSDLNRVFFDAVAEYHHLNPFAAVEFMIEKSAYTMQRTSFLAWLEGYVLTLVPITDPEIKEARAMCHYLIADATYPTERLKKAENYILAFEGYAEFKNQYKMPWPEAVALMDILDQYHVGESPEMDTIIARYVDAKAEL